MEFKLKGGMSGMSQLPASAPTMLMVPGALMVGFGILVLWNPELIRWIFAGVFILLGSLLTMAGLRAKRLLG